MCGFFVANNLPFNAVQTYGTIHLFHHMFNTTQNCLFCAIICKLTVPYCSFRQYSLERLTASGIVYTVRMYVCMSVYIYIYRIARSNPAGGMDVSLL